MLNKEKHQLVMGKILRDVYEETSVASLLGFKGGTCAYFLYGLTRFSVDLDFDLLETDETTQERVHSEMGKILSTHGTIKDNYIKRHTIFFLLSYGEEDHNIKIEINTRSGISNVRSHYTIRTYLGIPVLAATREYLFSSKLVALTERTGLAMRDVYDIWFFANENWTINENVIRERADETVLERLDACIKVIQNIRDNEIMRGLGELLTSEEAKVWVKTKLRTEVIFLLKNYRNALAGTH